MQCATYIRQNPWQVYFLQGHDDKKSTAPLQSFAYALCQKSVEIQTLLNQIISKLACPQSTVTLTTTGVTLMGQCHCSVWEWMQVTAVTRKIV